MADRIEGFPFLKEVDDSTLRQWKEFTSSPLYAFLRTHFQKKINEIANNLLTQEVFVKEPVRLAYNQGKVFGIRMILENFFGDVSREYERRLGGDATERTPKSR